MNSKSLILWFLLALHVTLSYQKSYVNETVKFTNGPVPKRDSFEKCNITLTNSSTYNSSIVESRLNSFESFDYRISFYKGRIDKSEGNAQLAKYELIILQLTRGIIFQTQFLSGVAQFNTSFIKETLINQSFVIAQDSGFQYAFVNTSLFGVKGTLLLESIINNSVFEFESGVVKNVTISFSQVTIENSTLIEVRFVNSSVCLEPTVELESVTFINSTVATPKKCSLNSFKEIKAQVKEVTEMENLEDIINEDFSQNILEAISNSDEVDESRNIDEEDKIKNFQQYFDQLDLIE